MKVIGLISKLMVLSLAITVLSSSVTYAAVDSSPDCDRYAVIHCGAFTKDEVVNKINNGDNVNTPANIQYIYSQFDLTSQRIQNDNFVNGIVYKNGDVKVGDKTVATNATTYIRGKGKVSVSQMGSDQAALIHLNSGGQFEYAVMTPCGNPVISGASKSSGTSTTSTTVMPSVIPNTGPMESVKLLIIFLVVSVSGAIVYRYTVRRR